jgi:hypothetical protein
MDANEEVRAAPADDTSPDMAKVFTAAKEIISGLEAPKTDEERSALLHILTTTLDACFPGKPDQAMGILMMGQTQFMRKILAKHGITDRGRKHRVIRAAVHEFDQRLRTYC